ncbi:MAG: S-layer homology domain-containing protein [Firmicutes bacterium]|nr:S-layer homology domain-containing protein [Bacillota bacterium]
MLKRGLALLLALVMLTSVASAVQATTPEGERYDVSAWAQKDVAEAWKIGLHKSNTYTDYRKPVPRGLFGADASRLVALAFGGDYDAYINYKAIQCQIKDQPCGKTVAEELGLLKGREDGNMDYDTAITRQEAAVVLARAYRSYCDEIHDDAEPLSYADNGKIADWAKTDVQLMTHLGIMNGVGENKFDPQGSYTLEQCLVTLVRLYNNTCKGKPTVKNDFFALTPDRLRSPRRICRPIISARQKMIRPLRSPITWEQDTEDPSTSRCSSWTPRERAKDTAMRSKTPTISTGEKGRTDSLTLILKRSGFLTTAARSIIRAP